MPPANKFPVFKKIRATVDVDDIDYLPPSSTSQSANAKEIRRLRKNAKYSAPLHIDISRNKSGRIVEKNSLVRHASDVNEENAAQWFDIPLDENGDVLYFEEDLTNNHSAINDPTNQECDPSLPRWSAKVHLIPSRLLLYSV
jgi:hypothetical protein